MTDPADTDLDDLLRTLPRAAVAAWCVATIERLVRRCPMAADWERYVPDPGWVDAQLDANPEFALILRKDAIRVAAMGKSGDDRIDAERAERDAQTNRWISGAPQHYTRWPTRNAFDTLTSDDETYAAAVEHARQSIDGETFAAWAWPRYAAMLRAAGYENPVAYAEPDAIDWSLVWERLRAD